MEKLAIVTGCTGGIGESLALELADRGFDLLLLGRDAERLATVIAKCRLSSPSSVTGYLADLAEQGSLDNICEIISGHRVTRQARQLFLFNNASQINPIQRVEDLTAEALESAIRVNLVAAFTISAAVLKARRGGDSGGRTDIINISSGVAVSPVLGWSVYCVAKAGLNMLTRCIALENDFSSPTIRALSINPGATDTAMQQIIRSVDPERFPSAAKFGDMFESGMLKSPRQVAKKIIDVSENPTFQSGEFVDFNKMVG